MKLSARNQLKGKIVSVKLGTTTAHVKINVGGTIVTAAITNELGKGTQPRQGQDRLRRHQGERRDGGCRLTVRKARA